MQLSSILKPTQNHETIRHYFRSKKDPVNASLNSFQILSLDHFLTISEVNIIYSLYFNKTRTYSKIRIHGTYLICPSMWCIPGGIPTIPGPGGRGPIIPSGRMAPVLCNMACCSLCLFSCSCFSCTVNQGTHENGI